MVAVVSDASPPLHVDTVRACRVMVSRISNLVELEQ